MMTRTGNRPIEVSVLKPDCMLSLPARTKKPRQIGLTSIHEVGVPLGELRSILEDYAAFVDIAKLGIGSAYVTPNLHEKVKLYHDHDVLVYFGGTLFEKFYSQGKLEGYLDFLREHNVKWIEVSNGTIDISLEERLRIVERIKDEFTVLAEIGCKDTSVVMPPSKWITEMKSLLDAGCKYVITEGRDSGTAGIYRPTGELREGLLADVLGAIDPAFIIFEAPQPKMQMRFINNVGTNVNLGNVRPRELLLLESQRIGLRNETFEVDGHKS